MISLVTAFFFPLWIRSVDQIEVEKIQVSSNLVIINISEKTLLQYDPAEEGLGP